MSGPGPYGPGRRTEPHEVPGGRRQTPFGPDISWPNGFRQLDSEARRLLESGYGRGQYDHVDPGYSAGRGSGYRPADSAPSLDDYGDPGYSDPSYDGPRSGSGGRGWSADNRGPRAGSPPASDGSGYGTVPGYHVPGYHDPAPGYQPGYATPDIYPVTGAQEALPDTGPQPIADSWPGRDAGSARSSRQAYPEQWYDHPRLGDPRGGGARPDSSPAPDPRLEGMRYDELRYDDPAGYDEPLDDDSWVEELRRSAPSYPQPSGGDQRRGDPRGPGYGQQPGWGPQPGIGQSGSYPQAFGYGREDRGGPDPMGPMTPRGPRMSACLLYTSPSPRD